MRGGTWSRASHVRIDSLTLRPLIQVAEGAERIGLAAVWTFERLLRPVEPVPFGGSGPPILLPDAYANVYDPVETLSYVVAKTSRIRLATLDRCSGGRLIAGLGQGWMPQEFIAAGVPPTRRGAGFQEHIEAMRAVWGPNPVRFEGRFYQVAESEIGPKRSSRVDRRSWSALSRRPRSSALRAWAWG